MVVKKSVKKQSIFHNKSAIGSQSCTWRISALQAIIASLQSRNRWNMLTASSSLIGCRAAATRYSMLCRIPPMPLTTLAYLTFVYQCIFLIKTILVNDTMCRHKCPCH